MKSVYPTRWPLRASALLLVAALGCDDSQGPAEFDAAASFDAFWETFDRTYSYFELKHIDWNEARSAYRDRAAAAVDYASLASVLREMVAPMRDVHIWFRNPGGITIPTWQSPHFRNWDRNVWLAYVNANQWVQQRTNWGYADFGGIPYITFGAWNSSQVNIDTVDVVLNQFRDRPGLIIDVRMNGGGNDALALQVAGRFTREPRLIEYVQFRDGPRHDDFTPLQPRYVQPRGPWQYEGRVVVLTGRGIFSSNETFVSAFREFPNATLIGDTTGGSSGNPGEFDLGGGWKYFVPRWIAYTADRQVIEWNGIPPDRIIPVTAADFSAGRDPVLDFALSFLRAQIAGRPRRVGRRRWRTASDVRRRRWAAAASGVSKRYSTSFAVWNR